MLNKQYKKYFIEGEGLYCKTFSITDLRIEDLLEGMEYHTKIYNKLKDKFENAKSEFEKNEIHSDLWTTKETIKELEEIILNYYSYNKTN